MKKKQTIQGYKSRLLTLETDQEIKDQLHVVHLRRNGKLTPYHLGIFEKNETFLEFKSVSMWDEMSLLDTIAAYPKSELVIQVMILLRKLALIQSGWKEKSVKGSGVIFHDHKLKAKRKK